MIEISKGVVLNNETGQEEAYSIYHADDLASRIPESVTADASWIKYRGWLIDQIRVEANGDQDKFIELFNKCSQQDYHWKWFDKCFALRSPEYEWLFFKVGGSVEAVAVLYHPKDSAISTGVNIFYVEYIAVAPWNRETKYNSRRYKGVGTRLLVAAADLCISNYGYRPGFSLHSLPQSVDFYKKIGMTDFGPDSSKGDMHFFEIEEQPCTELLGVAK